MELWRVLVGRVARERSRERERRRRRRRRREREKEQLVLVARGPVLTDIFTDHSASIYCVERECVSLDRKEISCSV